MPAGEIDSSINVRRLKKAVEDLAKLHQLLMQVASAANQQFMAVDNQMGRFGAILEVVTDLIGNDKVQGALDAKAIAHATAEAENARATLQEAIVNGKIIPTEAIALDTIVVGVQLDAEGNQMAPGYCQFSVGQSPPWMAPLIGQGIGATIETPEKTTIKVTAIYTVAPVSTDAPEIAPVASAENAQALDAAPASVEG